MSISGLHFLYVQCKLEKLYYLWTKSKVLLYYIHSFTYMGLIVYYVSYVLNAMYIILYPQSLSKGLNKV